MDDAKLARRKQEFLEHLSQTRDKMRTAKELGIELVQVRSWRHSDIEFNRAYKNMTVGKMAGKQNEDLKEEFLKLLKEGLSQRHAADVLHISIHTLRTWKKVDKDFKDTCNKSRQKFFKGRAGRARPDYGDEE